MMQTAENRCRHNAAIVWNAMSLKLKFSLRRSSVGHTRSQAGMWTGPIVMFHPRSERLSNVSLVHGNDEIQTLSTRCPNQSFAIGIGLRRFVRVFKTDRSNAFREASNSFRIDAVAIMNNE